VGTATFERVHGSSYAALSDSALAGLVAAGDGRAFEVVFTRFKDVLFKYSWTITGNREDAEEAVQTAMVNAYRALGEGSAPQAIALRPWLFRITHNASVTIIRARRPEAPLRDGVEPAGPDHGRAARPPGVDRGDQHRLAPPPGQDRDVEGPVHRPR